jgi:hypothetical protein
MHQLASSNQVFSQLEGGKRQLWCNPSQAVRKLCRS